MTDAVTRAYQNGQTDMRERAAMLAEWGREDAPDGDDRRQLAAAIRDLTVSTGRAEADPTSDDGSDPAERDATGVPVILSIGDTRAEVATITFDTTQPVGPQVAAMLRALADEFADDSAALADQLAEHREAIAYALRHTLAAWADATGHAEGAAAGSLHRALSWVTGHPTPPRDIPHEVTTLGLEVEDYRAATTRVEAHLEHLTRRLEETVRRVDDVETVVHHTDGDTPQNRIASQVEIAETLTTAGLGPTVARQIAYLLQQRFEIRQRPAEDGES